MHDTYSFVRDSDIQSSGDLSTSDVPTKHQKATASGTSMHVDVYIFYFFWGSGEMSFLSGEPSKTQDDPEIGRNNGLIAGNRRSVHCKIFPETWASKTFGVHDDQPTAVSLVMS